MSGALSGRTVAVTRATEQAGTLAELLRAQGATVLELPLITTTDPADGGAALAAEVARRSTFDWLIVTSPNGARRVRSLLGPPRPDDPAFAVIGTATERALGRPVELRPARQVAEGLLAEFPAGAGRVLLAQGDRARPALAEGLTALGWNVVRVVAYRTIGLQPSDDQRAALRAADALTFASGSAVRAYVDAFGTAGAPTVISIGPQTTAAASSAGLTVAREAGEHDLPGLVAAVVAALG